MKNINRGVFLLFLFLFIPPVSNAYNIVGDMVSYTNAYGQLNVTPHTSYELITHTQILTLTSFMLNSQQLDFAFQFNDTVKGKIYIKNGDSWTDITHLINHDTIYKDNYEREEHFYWIRNVNFAHDETKTVKLVYDRPPGTSGKWDLWVKRTSDNITEALNSGLYVHLDPWYNSSFNNRYEINITNVNAKAIADFIANITIDTASLISAGNMSLNCNVRIVDVNNNTFAHHTENCNNISSIFWTKFNNLPRGTTTIYMYSGNNTVPAIDNPVEVWGNYSLRLNCNTTTNNITYGSTPNNLNGSLRNGVESVSGIFGKGCYFPKSAQKTNLVITSGLPIPTTQINGTIEFWFKPNEDMTSACNEFKSLWSGDGAGRVEFIYDIPLDGGLNFRPDGNAYNEAAYTLTANTWYWIVQGWNDTHRPLWINGKLVDSDNDDHITINDGSTNTFIMSFQGTSNFVNGTLDEIRVRTTLSSENATHALYINVSDISYSISGLQQKGDVNETPTSNVTIYYNITVYDEITPDTQIETYNISIYQDGGRIFNQSGVNSSLININTTGFDETETTIIIDKAGYYQREQIVILNKTISYNLSFYLLETLKGINAGYQVVDTTGRAVNNAYVTISKNIGGSYSIINEYKTDTGAFISVYLNAETTYQITTTASGYTSDIRTSRPVSGNSYLIVLNRTITIDVDNIFLNNRYVFSPQQAIYSVCEIVDFKFTVSNILGNITYFGMNITLNGTIKVDFQNNLSINTTGGSLNRTLNLTNYVGNLTVCGNFTDAEYGTIMVCKFYKIHDSCKYGYTLQDLLNAFSNEDHGFSKELGGIFLIFIFAFIATSAGVVIGGNGTGLLALALMAMLPIAGILSWEIYILLGIATVSVMFLRNRL